jgi:WD40 repeat protein
VWASWAPSGTRPAVASDSGVRIFRAGDWSEESSFTHGDLVHWAAFHPDGRRLVTGSRDGVSVWDTVTKARLARVGDFRDRSVIRGAFSPDGSHLAVIAWDQTAAIFACDSWEEVRKLRGMGRPRGVCWSPDGTLLATSDETNDVHVWYPGDRPHLPVLRGHGDRVVGAAFHPDGKRALTASLDGSARLFDVGSGVIRHAMPHGKPLAAARFTSGAGEIVTIGGGRVVVWDAEQGGLLRELAIPGGAAVDAWPLEAGAVFITYEDGVARLWDARKGGVLRVFEGHVGPILSAAFHPGSGLAATGGSDRSARVWDLATGAAVATFVFPAAERAAAGTDLSRVFALCFDRTGKRLVAGCEDLRLRFWDVPGRRLEREVVAATPGMFAVDPAGRWLMTGAKWAGRVAFHEMEDSKTPMKTAPLQDSHMISAVRFSPAGTLAMAASKDGTIRLWSMDGIRPHAVFNAKCGIVLDADFSPDGRSVIVAGSDGTARIWPVDPVSVAERTCPVSESAFRSLKDVVDQALLAR